MIKQIGTLNIEIERRKIKNINIYVKPPNGDVLVTVPMRVSDEEVFRFLKKKEEWILKNHEKVKNRQNSSPDAALHEKTADFDFFDYEADETKPVD